jgi:peptidoglycan/xylan/chitin deacetylase (PgdA/CDA1 family)
MKHLLIFSVLTLILFSCTKDSDNLDDLETETRSSQTTIILTYDDGPGQNTIELLDTLANYGVKATFFVQGNRMHEYPNAIRREMKDGHSIGNHSLTHGQSYWPKGFPYYSGKELFFHEIAPTNDSIYKYTGITTDLYRPPFGSNYGNQKSYIISTGMQYWKWDIDTKDWAWYSTAMSIYDKVTSKIKVGKENVVLMHDRHPNGDANTILATSWVIQYCLKRGYVFKSL